MLLKRKAGRRPAFKKNSVASDDKSSLRKTRGASDDKRRLKQKPE
jgi:hypothetical protein